ncbi:MAG TPA: carboxypeptidase-like regulatory domain-containing protein, partial [Puia sp.]|nr:carboxypeptidase-like regulatory domain-containing protein [Puia sp.]
MRKLTMLAGLMAIVLLSAGQQTITGKIIDTKGNPLADISIKVKQTKKGTQTNAEGVFKIAAT